MRQMNMDELREGIDLGRAVIEDNLMDMYITKKLLANEGFPEEDLDGFIAQKVREYEERYAAMEDEEFMASLTEEWVHTTADPESTEDLEANARAIDEELTGLINVMDLQIGKVIRVKRALALAGVDPEEVAMAIADTAKEFDERYMKMSVTEIEETMFRRMAEIDEIVRSHPKG